jgi:hypothetical protein
MRVESLDTPSLLELRAIVAQRLQAYGTFNTWLGPPGSSSFLVRAGGARNGAVS